MTQDELLELLNAHEWRDVEFKEAQKAVPRNAYETVSAFANTDGGYLVFGVRKNGQDFEVVGVLDVDKVQSDFLTTLRQPSKLSAIVGVHEDLKKYGASDLLIFFVPEVHRAQKPVFLHQDYADHARKAELRHYADQTVFWNPGDAFATDADLLEPGEREVRNPRIVTAFRRLGLSEHAGWGLRDVFRNWQQLGRVPPTIANIKGRKCFELVLRKEELLSEHQILFQASLGVQLTNKQARVFAFGCREKAITLPQIKAIADIPGPEAVDLADTLVTQVLFRTIEAGRKYALAEHLEKRFRQTDRAADPPEEQREGFVTAQVQSGPDLSTAQVEGVSADLSTAQVPLLRELSATHWKIIALCDVPRRLSEIVATLGVTNRGYFKEHHLDPLIQAGIVAMTNPEKPRASNQHYIITEAGTQLKARRMSGESDRSEDKNG